MHLQKNHCCLSSLTVEQSLENWWFVFYPSCTTFLAQHFTVCMNRKPCLELTFQRRSWSIKAKFRTRSFFFFFLTSEEPLWTFGQEKKLPKKYFVKSSGTWMNSKDEGNTAEAVLHCWPSAENRKLKSGDERAGKLFSLNLPLLSSR